MKQKKKQQVQKVPLQSFPRAACMRMQREVGEVLPPLVLTGPAVTVTLPGDENMSRTTDGRRLSAFTQVLHLYFIEVFFIWIFWIHYMFYVLYMMHMCHHPQLQH